MTRTLIATSAAPLRDEAVAAARAAAPGAALRPPDRLGEGAVDLGLDASALEPVRATLPGVDVNAAPGAPRRKRLLIADMDSTIITVECIDEIADLAGVGARVAAITERAMRGEIDFEGALRERVALLAGQPVGLLERAFETRVRLTAGAAALARSMRAAGAVTALVSGGFDFFTERVAAAAGFEIHRANRLLTKDGRLTGGVAEPILGRAAKREALERLLAEHGLGPQDALAVGDGANDLEMIRRAGYGVAWRAKPIVAAEADARLEHSNLTALLYLQGWRQAQIITEG